jgi:thioredoxin 1
MTEVTTIEEFDKIIEIETPILLDFFAEWCRPCKMIAPSLQRLAKEYADKIEIFSIDVDKVPDIAARYEVYSIPTLLLIKNKMTLKEVVGALPYEEIRKKIEETFFSEPVKVSTKKIAKEDTEE